MIISAFIQNAKNSRLRNNYNESTLQFVSTSELLASASYQYGFIPGTKSDDGDCIDIWLISDHNYQPGTTVQCRVLGMLEMFEACKDERQDDYKIFVCPEDKPIPLTKNITTEIKSFTLEIFRKFPDVTVTFGNLLSIQEAENYIKNHSEPLSKLFDF